MDGGQGPYGRNGGSYTWIHDAILRARDGDTISVASGTVDSPAVYYEQIDFQGKSLLIAAREVGTEDWRALDHPDPRATIIDAQWSGPVVRFNHGERDAEIRGFTLKHGWRGVYVGHTADVTLRRLIIRENRLDLAAEDLGGAGIRIVDALHFLVDQCVVEDDTVTGPGGAGGGIVVSRSSGELWSCVIRNNVMATYDPAGGDLLVLDSSTVSVVQCLFYNDDGVMAMMPLLAWGSSEDRVRFVQNTVYFSPAWVDEPTARLDGTLQVEFSNNIWSHAALGGMILVQGGVQVITDFNCYHNQWNPQNNPFDPPQPLGSHDQLRDPLFVNPAQRDFHLQASSPVIDSGTNCVWRDWEEVDLDGNPRFVDGRPNPGEWYAIQVDKGVYEYPEGTPLKCGDVDRDGLTEGDGDDAKYLYYYLAGDPGYEICPLYVADVNEDGTVDMADYTYLDHYVRYGYPVPCFPFDTAGTKQALLATGEPEVQGQHLSLPVYGYLEAKSGGYLLEFQVPEGFTFTGAELGPEAPTGLVLYTRVEGPEVRLVVADTLPEDGLTYLEAGTQELVRLHLTYEGHPVGFVLTGKDLQFADTAGTRMLAGFVTGGSQAYVTLRDLATRITVVGSRVVQQDLRVRYSLSRTLEPAEVALYDAAGRRVRVLYRGTLAAGHREVVYPVGSVSDGVYFLRVKAPGFRHVEKVVVLR